MISFLSKLYIYSEDSFNNCTLQSHNSFKTSDFSVMLAMGVPLHVLAVKRTIKLLGLVIVGMPINF